MRLSGECKRCCRFSGRGNWPNRCCVVMTIEHLGSYLYFQTRVGRASRLKLPAGGNSQACQQWRPGQQGGTRDASWEAGFNGVGEVLRASGCYAVAMLGKLEGGQEKKTGAGSGQRRWGLEHEDEAMSFLLISFAVSLESVAHKQTVAEGTVAAWVED